METTKILTLEKELSKAISLVSELRASSEEKQTGSDIDFSKIIRYSSQAAFTEHYIKNLDIDVADHYCTLLLAAIDLLQDREKKVKQYYFVARIFEAVNPTKSLEELVTEAKMVSADDYVRMKDELSEEGRMAFLFDFLLMISLSGEIDSMQLDYYCETLSFFGIDSRQLRGLFETVKCVLSGEEDKVYDYLDAFPAWVIGGYMPKPVRRTVITDAEKLKNCAEKEVIVYGVSFKDESMLIDEYKKSDIRFLECKFNGISAMTAKKTKTRFEKCVFCECSNDGSEDFADIYFDREEEGTKKLNKPYAVFNFKNADFINCVFSDCKANNINRASNLLQLRNGKVKNCSFKNCSIGAGGTRSKEDTKLYEYGAILFSKETTIENCRFEDCKGYGNGQYGNGRFKEKDIFTSHVKLSGSASDYQYIHMILCKNGKVENCQFLRCICDGESELRNWLGNIREAEKHHYLINAINSTQSQNTFTQCRTASEPIGTAEWGIKIS